MFFCVSASLTRKKKKAEGETRLLLAHRYVADVVDLMAEDRQSVRVFVPVLPLLARREAGEGRVFSVAMCVARQGISEGTNDDTPPCPQEMIRFFC